MTPDTRALEIAIEAALAAGAILRAELHRPGGPRGGAGKAPADVEAEEEIRRRLVDAFPSWGYLGEETGAQAGDDAASPIWLVDPNDGTTSYLRGGRGSTVSIALLARGLPVLGVLHAFAAPDDRGDLLAWAEGCGALRRNGRELQRARWPSALGPDEIVLLSDRADTTSIANAHLVAPARFRAQASIAYRLGLVAAGEACAAVSINSPGAWDYAAGHALLRAAGGVLVNEDGTEVTYSREGRSRTRHCVGGAPRIVGDLAARDWDVVRRTPKPWPEPYDLVRLERGRAVANATLLARAQGCLLGQLAGDALGSLVEFQSPDVIRRAHPEGVRAMTASPVWRTLAGQPTDDSELALLLARSIVRAGRYDPEAAAQAYAFWYRSRPFDCGTTVGRALGAVTDADVAEARAAEASGAAANRESRSNGSIMRASPLGIWGHATPATELADVARADARLTHPHPVCGAAAAAYVVAIAHGIATGEGGEAMYARALEWVTAHARDAAVVDALRAARSGPPDDFVIRQGDVLVALHNAFFQLLHAPTLEDAVVDTVMSGGDTDTNAAVAGALAGAALGRDAVPDSWRRAILTCRPIDDLPGVERPRPRACWPVDALALAERLL